MFRALTASLVNEELPSKAEKTKGRQPPFDVIDDFVHSEIGVEEEQSNNVGKAIEEAALIPTTLKSETSAGSVSGKFRRHSVFPLSDVEESTTTDVTDRPRLLLTYTDLDYEQLEKSLGRGTMRFSFSRNQRTVNCQIDSLAPAERSFFDRLKAEGESIDLLMDNDDASHSQNDELYLRFSRCSHFDYDKASECIKQWRDGCPYYTLRCKDVKDQLHIQTLFIPPNLRTRSGLDVFYMKPSRYNPKETPTATIINNLAYVLQVMQEKEQSSTEGVAFVANMADWTRHNFSLEYCREFMEMLEGWMVPARIELFLIVDPPAWFGIIYNVLCQILSDEFLRNVKVIRSEELGQFLEEGYQEFLPDEMEGGKCKSKAAVDDFIRWRTVIEEGYDPSGVLRSLFSKVVNQI